ncbi:MAG: phage holin family protein [Deltaproteobacteria bacterium]|nr:phage holin family protein [Deltaproteobacteria bacterium]
MLLLRWLINTVALLAVVWLVGGIRVDGFGSAIIAAAIIGLLNAFLRPLLYLIALPLIILTLGLFTFVVNGLMLLLAASILPGFHVAGFWAGVWGALLFSIVSWILSHLLVPQRAGQPRFSFQAYRRQPRPPGPGQRENREDRIESEEPIDLERDSEGKWR